MSTATDPRTTAGPTLHHLVELDRIGDHVKSAKAYTADTLGEVGIELGRMLEVRLQQAYREGVRDGFLQGAVAEAATRVGCDAPASVREARQRLEVTHQGATLHGIDHPGDLAT